MTKSRSELQKIVTDNGGEVKSSVSGGLAYLVIANPRSNSSKAKKARSIGTKLISEQEFLALIS